MINAFHRERFDRHNGLHHLLHKECIQSTEKYLLRLLSYHINPAAHHLLQLLDNNDQVSSSVRKWHEHPERMCASNMIN